MLQTEEKQALLIESEYYDLYAAMEYAEAEGGDFYDFFMLDGHNLGFAIGDACDKGKEAAGFMTVSRKYVRKYALEYREPDKCLSRVNALLSANNDNCMFATVFYGVLNTLTGRLSYSNGGHNPPYILRKSGAVEKTPLTNDVGLGFDYGHKYQSNTVDLRRGDIFFLYTDGVTEAMCSGRTCFGADKLACLLGSLNGGKVDKIGAQVLNKVREHALGACQSDDITMLILKFIGLKCN